MATIHVDLLNGDDVNDGSIWALAKKTIPNESGHTIKLSKTADPFSLSVNATWTNGSENIVTASPLTKSIETAVGNTWSFSANVTGGTYTSQRKYGANIQVLSVAVAFTTGKVAWKTLPSTLDLSSYQSVSLWAMVNNIANGNNSQLRLCLCSDANGDTIVDSFSFDSFVGVSMLEAMLFNKGSALGASINSIAIYADADGGSFALRLNNIFACNDLNLLTLVGQSDSVGSRWFGIQSIIDDTIIIDNGDILPTTTGYSGDTNTTTIYGRYGVVNKLGFTSSIYRNITSCDISGGWNTATDEVDGETIFDGTNFMGIFFSGNNLSIENIIFTRHCSGVGTGISLSRKKLTFINCYSYQALIQANEVVYNPDTSIEDINIFNCQIRLDLGLIVTNLRILKNIFFQDITFQSTGLSCLYVTSNYGMFENIAFINIGNGAVPLLIPASDVSLIGHNNYFKNVTIDGANVGVRCGGLDNIFDGLSGSLIAMQQSRFTSRAFIKNSPINISSSSYINFLHEENIDCVDDNNKVKAFNSMINCNWQTDVKRGSDLGSWYVIKGSEGGANDSSRNNPNKIKVAEIAVDGGVEITVGVWIKQNSVVTTLNKLLVSELDSPVISDTTKEVINDTEWNLNYFSITPVKAGVLNVHLVMFRTSNLYVGSVVLL
jgi:hypothetical protein